jgi:hypothetical protein
MAHETTSQNAASQHAQHAQPESPSGVSNLPEGDRGEVRSLDLNQLMSTDPLELTVAHLDEMVARMREARKNWAAEEELARKEGRKPKASAANLNVSDLNLDL